MSRLDDSQQKQWRNFVWVDNFILFSSVGYFLVGLIHLLQKLTDVGNLPLGLWMEIMVHIIITKEKLTILFKKTYLHILFAITDWNQNIWNWWIWTMYNEDTVCSRAHSLGEISPSNMAFSVVLFPSLVCPMNATFIWSLDSTSKMFETTARWPDTCVREMQ